MINFASASYGATEMHSKSRSRTTTEERKMTTRQLEPIHPGEILEEEFMIPLGLSANALARRIDVPVTRISEIVRGNRGITADTALRLARLFGTSSELWLGLQAEYDLRLARRDLAPELQRRIVPLKGRASLYGEQASSAKSTVGEHTEPYDTSPIHRRTRDRRRTRRDQRPSPKETFLNLADRLARSSSASEQKRLKEELARMTFGK
jgi:addiction module HigA family antidote